MPCICENCNPADDIMNAHFKLHVIDRQREELSDRLAAVDQERNDLLRSLQLLTIASRKESQRC